MLVNKKSETYIAENILTPCLTSGGHYVWKEGSKLPCGLLCWCRTKKVHCRCLPLFVPTQQQQVKCRRQAPSVYLHLAQVTAVLIYSLTK